MENPRLTIKSKKLNIAKEIISNHFTIGSIGYDEALDCSIVTAKFMQDDELVEILIKIKEWEVRNGNLYPNKEFNFVNQTISSKNIQMSLFI